MQLSSSDSNMDYIPASTSQVLNDCLHVLQSPAHTAYLHNQQQPTLTHPDIQYFQKIKSKNHFNYHKFKTTSINVSNTTTLSNLQSSVFDPLSHDDLMVRLKTFNSLNWRVPPHATSLNELKCARNGWKCTSFALNSHTKNNLLCTGCSAQVVLKFESTTERGLSSFENLGLDFEEEEEEDSFTELLEKRYLKQVITDAHSSNCSWRNFETPLEGVYYPRPYLNSTNELLIRDYLNNLKSLIENSIVLKEFSNCFKQGFISDDVEPGMLNVSNKWLLARFFSSNKENFAVLLEYTPPWFYRLAMLGWSLNVQRFNDQLILLLVCGRCNQRMFLNSKANEFDLSKASTLTPCTLPISGEEDDTVDPYDHKQWCCNINDMVSTTSTSYIDYFSSLIANSSDNMGPAGEYMNLDEDVVSGTAIFKRRKSFDIEDGLTRLDKLRKLYLG